MTHLLVQIPIDLIRDLDNATTVISENQCAHWALPSRTDKSVCARISGHLEEVAWMFVILPGFCAHLAHYWAVCQTAK